MDGFQRITPSTLYSQGRGYGLDKAQIWRVFDALQPDPLYQDFICIERGGLAVDLPNGRYRVVVNLDSPSGFWGEYQVYRERAILAEGRPRVVDKMDFRQFQEKCFRFWNVEDSPADRTFDKYQRAYFQERSFDVDVTDGQLNIDFQGENWGCCVSSLVLFPVSKAPEGAAFLEHVEQKRRFYFDNYFKRVLHRATGDPIQPTAEDSGRGYITFQRDYMQEVYYNDSPDKSEIGKPVRGEAFAGALEPVTFSLLPLRDLGRVKVQLSDLRSSAGMIPTSAIDVGFVSYRISRVTMEGTVYTISPRLIMPTNEVEMPKDVTRRFWLTFKIPADASPGLYHGVLTVLPENGRTAQLPVEFTVRAGQLDAVDVPVGPWGHAITIPWNGGDPAAAGWNQMMMDRSLRKMREYGCTARSGIPSIAYHGFQDGQPILDFMMADQQMRLVKELGFLAVVSYGRGLSGFNAYYQDTGAMNGAGFAAA